jgi:hypothetical protein
MKRVGLLMLMVLNVIICWAPTLPKPILEEQKRFAIVYLNDQHHYKEFVRFSAYLGLKESNNNPAAINCIGCFSEYQFKESTLRVIGYAHITLKRFKNNPGVFPPDVQRQALQALVKTNWAQLHAYQWYIGQTINGVIITKAGLLAAAHLGGVGGVKLFLLSGGRVNRHDINNTTIKNYLTEFQGYDL